MAMVPSKRWYVMQSKMQMCQQIVIRQANTEPSFSLLTTAYGFVPRVGEEIELRTDAYSPESKMSIVSNWKVVRVVHGYLNHETYGKAVLSVITVYVVPLEK